jgi:molecular chaperone GrpE
MSERKKPGKRSREEEEVPVIRVVDRRRHHDESPDESTEAEETADEYPTFVEQLRARTEEAEEKLREYIEAYRREREELDAVRKRLTEQAETRAREAIGRSFGRFLEVVDNLERALSHADEDDPMREGVQQTYDLLLSLLQAEGLERVAPLGESFDPEASEAIMTRPSDEENHGRVLEVVQPGYRFDGKTLRPARVVVGRQQA